MCHVTFGHPGERVSRNRFHEEIVVRRACFRTARFAAGLLAVAWLTFASAATVPTSSASGPAAPATAAKLVDAGSYYLGASQLDHPLRPFGHLPTDAPIRVHAAVVTVPDPVETRLGRSFDIELAALVSAFQASDYVLDGFAFTWTPRQLNQDGVQTVPKDKHERDLPSVLLFRKDDWRNCVQSSTEQFCGSTYFVIFMVGETPSSGVHPEAFARAARCAMALDGANRVQHPERKKGVSFPSDFNGADCDRLAASDDTAGSSPLKCERQLLVIGPAFSGSMESMAAALTVAAGKVAPDACSVVGPAKNKSLDIQLLSPSASISSNDNVQSHAYLKAADTDKFQISLHYQSLAYSVTDQMQRVLGYLRAGNCVKSAGKSGSGAAETARPDKPPNVVVFGEESSFGLGAANLSANKTQGSSSGSGCLPLTLFNVQFPPNIASIRAEHVRMQQDNDKQRRAIMPERLLELDLTGVDQGIDQPPSYQPSLSSRSDELMLYQTFDALNEYVNPVAIIIVATDVRDRLFLLSEIRNAFPAALPIVLEQDNLLVHPDYRATSRGSITMPAGNTLVCLFKENEHVKEDACFGGHGRPRYFTFATDYAANTFRAAIQLANNPANELTHADPPGSPAMLVATLAGFQQIKEPTFPCTNLRVQTGNEKHERCSNTLIVADTRLQLQLPIYLAMVLFFVVMLVVTYWLIWNGRRVALVTFPVIRHALRWIRVKPNGLETPCNMSRGWLWGWLVLALAGLVVSAVKLGRELADSCQHCNNLAHGRDRWTLIGLCLGYGCFVALSVLRGQAWNARCASLSREVHDGSQLRIRLCQQGRWRAIIGTVGLMLCLYLSVSDLTPTTVDSSWASGLSGLFALGGSMFFLIIFLEGLDRWRRVSLELGKTLRVVNAQAGADATLSEWPTPGMLDEPPRSPFNIVMRVDNYHAWHQQCLIQWIGQTNALLAGQWPFKSESDGSFAQWQAQLVAEMKLAAVAVRTAAWCSILGATLALVLIQVYPPVYERLQTTVAAILLGLGALSIIYAVINLEKDYLLGRMFTNDKDHLTFGGALSALWPKLLGLGTMLVMIFLPDVWDWLGGLIKAVNSIR